MKKLFKLFLCFVLTLLILPINNISAEENSIPIEIQEKLNTYVTYPNNLKEWESMDSEEIVVHIEGYKITRGDYIKLNDYANKVDASKIKPEDYVESNSRAITSSYVNLGSNSVGARYKSAIMYYTTSYGSLHSEVIYRVYSTRTQIINSLNEKDNGIITNFIASGIIVLIGRGMAKSVFISGIPIVYVAEAAFAAVTSYQLLLPENAFRTYAAGGNGGYTDKIENEKGKTVGYGVWNQTTIEIKSGSSNGQTVTTTYEKSTNG